MFIEHVLLSHTALVLELRAAPADQASTAHAADVRYVYDESGRLVQVIDPDGKSTCYRYDAAGNIIAITQDLTGALVISEFIKPLCGSDESDPYILKCKFVS